MTPEEKQKITADELHEQDNAIDAFQLYSRYCLDTIVVTQSGFMEALAYYLNAMPEDKGQCWECKHYERIPYEANICLLSEENEECIFLAGCSKWEAIK